MFHKQICYFLIKKTFNLFIPKMSDHIAEKFFKVIEGRQYANMFAPDSKKLISSYFKPDHSPVMNFVRFVKETSGVGEKEFVYKIDMDYEMLESSILSVEIPAIQVKTEHENDYRICWPRYLLNKIADKVVLNLDNKVKYVLNTDILMISSQYFLQGRREAYDLDIGNIPELTEWTTFLTADNIKSKLPMPYEGTFALPLIYKNTNTVFEIDCVFNLEIKGLLRMQKLIDGVWRDLNKPNMSVLNGVNTESKIPTPTITQFYTKNTLNEKTYMVKCDTYPIKYVYRNFQEVTPDKEKKGYNENKTIKVSTEKVVLADFFVSENITSSDKNNYNNYTTNHDNSKLGYDPISRITKYVGDDQLNAQWSLPTHIMKNTFCDDTFPSLPCERGFFGFPNSKRLKNNDLESGQPYIGSLNIRFTCEIRNTNKNLKKPAVTKQSDKDEYDDIVIKPDLQVEGGQAQVKNKGVEASEFNVKCYLLVQNTLLIDYKDGIYSYRVEN
jgi:hypothetical protein